jgi:hypothetical protein
MTRPFSFDAMPLMVSPPLLFQFEQTAVLLAGIYEFLPVRIAFTPDRPVNPTATYYFKTITTFADITEEDYSSAIAEMLKFRMFLESEAGGSFLREPVRLGKYLDNLPFDFALDPAVDPNRFQGSLEGVINQTPSLIGKPDITVTVIIAAQEINDQGFADSLKAGYVPK